MTNFQGDRGANRLATNNERELVPYFIEDTVRRFRKKCNISVSPNLLTFKLTVIFVLLADWTTGCQ
jgi:hypothetical protein